MKNHFGIYCIKNKVNNKVYIGKTMTKFQKRWFHHRSLLRAGTHNNKYLQKSWNKYGEENFEFIILESFDICLRNKENDETLNDILFKMEKLYIKMYNSYKDGYNETTGGEGCCGIVISEEHKRCIAEKNRINMLGRKHTKETKKKMSESHKGYIKTEEHRRHLSESLTGKKVSLDTRKKLSKINKNNKYCAKYNVDTILNIKRDKMNGLTGVEISKKYNISQGYIYSILSNRRWDDVNPEGWLEFIDKK